MFTGTHDEAQQAAIVFSLFATRKINGKKLTDGSQKHCQLYLITLQTNYTNSCPA